MKEVETEVNIALPWLSFILCFLTYNIIMNVYSIFIWSLWFCPVLISLLQCSVAVWWSVYKSQIRPKVVNEWTWWDNEMQHQSPRGSSFSLSAEVLAGCICLCPPLYGPWWIAKRIWLIVKVFFLPYSSFFLVSFLFFSPPPSPLARWQRAGEMNSVKFNHGNWRFGGMRSWPHGQFGDCFRLINVKMERPRP